ncbi:MAG TPA: DUF4333 domain-containing protein [Jatrophihabitantaceae bacterium]|jgi:hypothetical protein
MASDNGDQGNQGDQPWPQPPQNSQWGPSSEHSSSDQGAEPADDEPEEATIARPIARPPSSFGESDNAPTTQYSLAEQPADQVSSGDPASGEPADSGPSDLPGADDDRTQAFSRSDLRAQPPTPPIPSFPPPPPGGSYQPQPPTPPSYPPPTPQQSPAPPSPQGYPQPAPYQPEQPYQPDPSAWGQPYAQQPHQQQPDQGAWPQQQPDQGAWPQQQPYGQQPYQPEPGYPQQPYGAPPQQQPYGQYSPYGQQPYSPYPPAPPKKRHVGLWIGGAVVAVIVILAVVAFVTKPGFLGFKKVLDHTAVEKTIEKGGYTNVKCNNGKNPKVKKGATFTCTADGGKKVTVTITSDSGNYAWSPAS